MTKNKQFILNVKDEEEEKQDAATSSYAKQLNSWPPLSCGAGKTDLARKTVEEKTPK